MDVIQSIIEYRDIVLYKCKQNYFRYFEKSIVHLTSIVVAAHARARKNNAKIILRENENNYVQIDPLIVGSKS